MEREQLVALYLLHRRRKKRRIRTQWVDPYNRVREDVGAFRIMYGDLRRDERKFFNFYRMSTSSFDELFGRLQETIQRQNTKMRNCIQPLLMLALTLRFLATGNSFTDMAYYYRIGISTMSRIVKDVCRAISSVMSLECFPQPTKEFWESIASGFEENANFPHCIGAVDGKHCRIECPAHSGSMYFNYKDFYSVVLMAVADSKYKFSYVQVGSYGKDCDSSVFKECSLWKSILDGSQTLPEEKCLPGTESPKVPYFFVGDAAFGLHKHLLRPFGGKHLTDEKKVFNYRLCRARRYVECAFGILSNKWRVFHTPLKVKPDLAIDIIKACTVLHNFVRDRDGYLIEDTTSVVGLEDLGTNLQTGGGLSANTVRNIMCQYFMTSVGSVPWQMTKI